MIGVLGRGGTMVAERRFEVLRAIIEDYVATEEPVGSKALTQRHHLGVSPATIRNDMASLEDGGYITQPHTSAGRVPTDKGYRLFVDRLASVKPLSAPERRAIESFLEGAVDLDDAIGRTVRLLAQLTHQVAVVQYPSLVRSAIRHVELVSLSPTRVMFVLITDTGRVEQRSVEMPDVCPEMLLGELRAWVNATCVGSRLADVSAKLGEFPSNFETADEPIVRATIATLTEMSAEQNEERIVLAGTSNLAKFGGDFSTSVRPVLEALEEQVVLLRLLGEAAESVTVRIGHEHQDFGLHSTSLIATGYGRTGDPLANLGILGPTRMDYPGSIAAVRAVAAYVGAFLTESV
ncbi:MAG TPA: heat-inducible transcriptional repressor HrcA [Candidatus Nanopelagicaceae bacterium]|nr:heat-inducible transcriptional repressor HrcA [Candidatus Nanopelagicaceae bacterium]